MGNWRKKSLWRFHREFTLKRASIRGCAECYDELQCSFQTIEEDEDVGNMQNADLVDADLFVRDLVVTQCGQIYTEENCQTRITESLPRGFHFEEMEGVIKSDFNGSRVSSANPMELLKEPETPKRAESPRIYSDEEQTNEKVKKQEFALRNVKPECVSWDESAATAKLLERKAHVAAGSFSKRTNREEIEHAQVTALARPTTKNTESSVNPPHLNLVNVLVGIFLLIAIAAIFHYYLAPSVMQHHCQVQEFKKGSVCPVVIHDV